MAKPVLPRWRAVTLRLMLLSAAGLLHAADPSAAPPRPTIAVLPFENRTGDPDQAHWVEGINDVLRWQLAKVKAMRVRSGQAVRFGLRQLRLEPGDPCDAQTARRFGEQIEARRVIWGSYAGTNRTWTATLRVLTTATGETSPPVSTTGTNWLELTEQLALQVLKRLGVEPPASEREEMARRPTSSMAAFEWLAKASALEWREAPKADLERLFRLALAEDPDSTWALRGLAWALLGQGDYAQAGALAERVSRLSPGDGECHVLVALARLAAAKDAPEVERELEEALRADPESVSAWRVMGSLRASQGAWDQAIAAFIRAAELEPIQAGTQAELARAYAAKGNRERALSALGEAERLADDHPDVHRSLMLAYGQLGNVPKAIEHYERCSAGAKRQGLNPQAMQALEAYIQPFKARRRPSSIRAARPPTYSPAGLAEALRSKLTAEERALIVNPIETTEAMTVWARELTAGGTNDFSRAGLLFEALARRAEPRWVRGQRTAREAFEVWDRTEIPLSCVEYGLLYVVLARVVGLDAYLALIERDAEDRVVYHACAAVFADGQAWLVDPMYRWFGVPHPGFTVLDDLQMVAYWSAQTRNDGRDVVRSRAAVTLFPGSAWTLVAHAVALLNAGQDTEAGQVLDQAQRLEADRWDVSLLRGYLRRQDGDTRGALPLLERARTLCPGIAETHFFLAESLAAQGQKEAARDEFRLALRYEHNFLFEPVDEMADEARRMIAEINELVSAQAGESVAIEALHRKAGTGDVSAQFNYATALLRGPNPEAGEVVRWFTAAAEQGHVRAQSALGQLYLKSKLVPPQPTEALPWLRRAGEQGDPDALYALAVMYLQGMGVPPDAEAGMKWAQRAAERGHPQACFNLGKDYYEGERVTRDYVEAHFWFCRAREANHPEAPSLLKELELFMTPEQLAQARRRATAAAEGTAPKSDAE